MKVDRDIHVIGELVATLMKNSHNHFKSKELMVLMVNGDVLGASVKLSHFAKRR